jgi:hypothetical protein
MLFIAGGQGHWVDEETWEAQTLIQKIHNL